MKLIDRVKGAVNRDTEEGRELAELLGRADVYDITPIQDRMTVIDVTEHIVKPPAPVVWVEREVDTGGGLRGATEGVLFWPLEQDHITLLFAAARGYPAVGLFSSTCRMSFKPDGKLDKTGVYNCRDTVEGAIDSRGLIVDTDEDAVAVTVGVMLHAFNLLNTRLATVETHVPDERTQRRAQKAGCPPRSTWKTLKLVVPYARRSPGVSEPSEGDGPKVRRHDVRGHSRLLAHPRFKRDKDGNVQTITIEPHKRGCEALGTVFKTYELHPNPDAQ